MSIVQKFIEIYKHWNDFRNNIPKQLRFTLGTKIDALFIDTLELLFTASYLDKERKLPLLQKAQSKLDLLKFFLQISWELKALDDKKYILFSEHLTEVGKMLGGWRRGIESKTPAR